MMTFRTSKLKWKPGKGIYSSLVVLFAVMLFSPGEYAQTGARHKWKQYSVSYKKNRDYKSLKALVKLLKIGMPQSQVECLLGKSDASPVEGQHCYSSDMPARHGGIMGLVVEYRRFDRHGDNYDPVLTGRLESFELGPIRE